MNPIDRLREQQLAAAEAWRTISALWTPIAVFRRAIDRWIPRWAIPELLRSMLSNLDEQEAAYLELNRALQYLSAADTLIGQGAEYRASRLSGDLDLVLSERAQEQLGPAPTLLARIAAPVPLSGAPAIAIVAIIGATTSIVAIASQMQSLWIQRAEQIRAATVTAVLEASRRGWITTEARADLLATIRAWADTDRTVKGTITGAIAETGTMLTKLGWGAILLTAAWWIYQRTSQEE